MGDGKDSHHGIGGSGNVNPAEMKQSLKHSHHKAALIVVGSIVLLAIAGIGAYCYENQHYDDNQLNATWAAGYTEKQVVLSDGSTINYAEGPDNGTPLLLVHGQQVEWENYYSVLPDIAKNHHVFAIDCYGHGQSSHDAALYSCEANGKAIVEFIDTAIGQPVILSGHSSGGILAAWVAAYAPQDVTGVVLEDPPLFEVTPEEMSADAGCFAWKDSFEQIHGFLNQSDESDWPTYYAQHGYLFSLFGGLQPKAVEWVAAWRAKHPIGAVKPALIPHAWLETFQYVDDYDLLFGEAFYDGTWMSDVNQQDMLESIQCPVVYIKANTHYGADGVLYAANSDDDASKVQDCIASCTTVRIESGHGIHVEHPTEFCAAFDALAGMRQTS